MGAQFGDPFENQRHNMDSPSRLVSTSQGLARQGSYETSMCLSPELP